MSTHRFHSAKLNLVVDICMEGTSIEEVFSLKESSAKEGLINPETRILAIVFGEVPSDPQAVRQFARDLLSKLPQYNGTRTAVVASTSNTTASTIILSRDAAQSQYIEAFSTLAGALEWLELDMETLLEEVPDSLPFLNRA